MKLIASLKDNQYPFNGVDHVRRIVRCILLNGKNEICLEHILDDDMFGHRDYYETPGGGVNEGELFLDALKREMKEEVGCLIEVVCEIGKVKDYYNLIKRRNINYYYIAKVVGHCPTHLEPDEVKRIDKIIWVNIDEAISLYENMQDELVGKIVKQRELPILKLAKSTLQNNYK